MVTLQLGGETSHSPPIERAAARRSCVGCMTRVVLFALTVREPVHEHPLFKQGG